MNYVDIYMVFSQKMRCKPLDCGFVFVCGIRNVIEISTNFHLKYLQENISIEQKRYKPLKIKKKNNNCKIYNGLTILLIPKFIQ